MRLQTTALLLACATPLTFAPLSAGRAQQSDFRWERQLAADKMVNLHNLSGRVTVSPSTSGKVEIVGTRRGRGRDPENVTIEVYESERGITACSMYKNLDMECDDGGFQIHSHSRGRRDRDYDDTVSIDMEVKVPKGMRVSANSGDVDVYIDVLTGDGMLNFSSVSGDVRLRMVKP
ncbi:MAG: hypothetical protein AABZ80_11685 [Gemmatimonadota bacterium]|mgnify:CR=1 FL=1